MERHRKIGSVKKELAIKAREAMLSAVQIYNNPNIQFKSPDFVTQKSLILQSVDK